MLISTDGEAMVCYMGQQPDPNRGYEMHWVLPYSREELCQCTKVLFGGVNMDVPEGAENHFHPEEPFLFINNLEEMKRLLFDPLGKDYRGYVSVTRSGRQCQMWTAQSPHGHGCTPEIFPNAGLGEHNYCRNPDSEPEGPWCYTVDETQRWEYCEVELAPCGDSIGTPKHFESLNICSFIKS